MRDALVAAREWKARPSTMLGVLDVGDWSEADRYLAQALTLHDGDLCPGGCGFYLDETAEMDGYHSVKRLTCDACGEMDRDRIEHEGAERVPGELAYVVRDD